MSISHAEIKQWFSIAAIRGSFPPSLYCVETVATTFMINGGHRWRPYLFAGVYHALTGNTLWTLPLLNVAIALECFHKASLIHDDIEDDDKPDALHRSIGIPEALNAGDFLIHFGYSHLLSSSLPATMRLVDIACENQKLLCLGQGEELHTHNNNFSNLKTAPLFAAAFRMATACAEKTVGGITWFSTCLGQAYQAFDDLRDGVGAEHVLQLKICEVKNALNAYDGALREFLNGYVDLMFTSERQFTGNVHSAAETAHRGI